MNTSMSIVPSRFTDLVRGSSRNVAWPHTAGSNSGIGPAGHEHVVVPAKAAIA